MTKEFEVFIDPEFENLIPPLSPQEFAQLRANLRAEGIREPLTCWCDPATGKKILIDGHNRWKIWQEDKLYFSLKLRSEPEFRVFNWPNRESAMLWATTNQLGRRNLNEGQRAIMWDVILEQRSKLALLNAAAKARQAKANAGAALAKTAKLEKTDNREVAAKEAGLTVHKIRMARKIREGSPTLAEEVLAGTKTWRDAIKELKAKSAFPELKVGDDVRVDGYPDCPAIKQVLTLNALTIDLGDFGLYRRDNGVGQDKRTSRHISKIANPEDRLQLAELEKQKEEKAQRGVAIARRAADLQILLAEKGWPCEVVPTKGGFSLKFTFLRTEQVEEMISALPAPALAR